MPYQPALDLKNKVVDLLLTNSKPPDIDLIISVLEMVRAEIRFRYENRLNMFRDKVKK